MPKGVINLGPVHAYLPHPRMGPLFQLVPIGSFSGKLIEHRKRAQHLESIELADESEGADRYDKCTWVTAAEVRSAGPRQDRERISLNFEMASINLRQFAFSAT